MPTAHYTSERGQSTKEVVVMTGIGVIFVVAFMLAYTYWTRGGTSRTSQSLSAVVSPAASVAAVSATARPVAAQATPLPTPTEPPAPFTSTEGRFSILMPKTPVRSSVRVDSILGNLDVTTLLDDEGARVFAVAFLDLPKPVSPAEVDGTLTGAATGSTLSITGNVLRSARIDLNGIPGREVALDPGGGKIITMRLYLAHLRRLYQVSVATTASQQSSPDVGRFLDSFKILGG